MLHTIFPCVTRCGVEAGAVDLGGGQVVGLQAGREGGDTTAAAALFGQFNTENRHGKQTYIDKKLGQGCAALPHQADRESRVCGRIVCWGQTL